MRGNPIRIVWQGKKLYQGGSLRRQRQESPKRLMKLIFKYVLPRTETQMLFTSNQGGLFYW